jgi:hypothetical protein
MKQFRHKNVFEEIKNKAHDEDWIGLPPKMATAAKPGATEEIEVMVARLAAGEDLHHPNDERQLGTIEQSNEMQLIILTARLAKQEQERAEKLAKDSNCEQREIKQTGKAAKCKGTCSGIRCKHANHSRLDSK